jgi:hypothetical protein
LQIECIGCVSAILPDLSACHPLNTKSRHWPFGVLVRQMHKTRTRRTILSHAFRGSAWSLRVASAINLAAWVFRSRTRSFFPAAS